MFIRVKTNPNSPRKSVQIVENKRGPQGNVKQKIVHYVGIAFDEVEEEKLKIMGQDIIAKIKLQREQESPQESLWKLGEEDFIDQTNSKAGRPKTKKIEDILPPSQVLLDDVEEEKRIIEGVDEVGTELYKDLGFENLLKFKRHNAILKELVLTRMVEHQSKHKLQKILHKKFDKEIDLDAIYRTMDSLHSVIDNMKLKVFNATKKLMPEQVSLLFFDVTTLYFESTQTSEDDIRKFGYSKDHRFNTTQVILAMATNLDGLPVGYELFEGNKAEVKTLVESIEKWQKTLQIEDVCFVGDRAMFSEANLKLLEEKNYKYVVAAKLRSLKRNIQEEILNQENYVIQQFDKEIGWVGEFDLMGRRLIASYKTKRAINDAKSRMQIIDKINKALNKTKDAGKLITNNGVKKYTKALSKSEVILDEDKIAQDAMWDGLHGVVTNMHDRSATEILSHYSRLWVIEEAFRINKHNLQIRPIYHYKRERIESHIALCYMSFAILRHLQYKVALTQKISVDDMIEELLGVQASIHVHKKTKDRYRLPGAFSQTARKIYKALGLQRSQDATIYLK